ncbi:MAG: DUF1573 domain-containing protein [Thermoguttaceae bacterium]|jgi:hypothetical protein
MRAILLSIVGGAVLGLVVGLGAGHLRSAFYSWEPEFESYPGKAFALKAQSQSDPDVGPAKEKVAKVKIDEVSYDFGILEKNPSTETGEHAFYIENVGDGDLTLADGGKGCFCTNFTISKTTLKPGEKATVLFEWDAARSGGVFNQGIRVLTNDPEMKEVIFSVKGLYTAPVIAVPSELTFNNASTSAETTRTFRLFGFEHNDDETPFDLQIERTELTDPDHFTVELEKDDVANMTTEEKESQLLRLATSVYNGKVVMKTGMPQGSFLEQLRLRLNSPKTPIIELPIRGTIMGSEIKVLGPLYDDKASGVLRIDNVERQKGTTTNLRLLVFEPIPVNSETVFVKSVRPDWIEVDFNYPDEELQRTTRIRQIEVIVSIPPNSPTGAFMGPGKDQFGEIVLQIGADEANAQMVVVPVRFAIGQ